MNDKTLEMEAVIVDQARAKYYFETVYKLMTKNIKGLCAIQTREPEDISSNIMLVNEDVVIHRLREFVEGKVFKYCDENNVDKYLFKVDYLGLRNESFDDIPTLVVTKFEYTCQSKETGKTLNISFIINEENKCCYVVLKR